MKQNILIATLLAAMLALAGCGGGSSNVVNTAAQIKVDINACTTAQCVDAELAKASEADRADLMATADAKKKALADMNDNEPKSVAADQGIDLDSGKTQTVEVKAGTPRTFGDKTYTCPEGTCEITFTNVLGTITAMATGGVTVADKAVAPNPQLPPTGGVQRSSDKASLVQDRSKSTHTWHFEIKDGNTNAVKSANLGTITPSMWYLTNLGAATGDTENRLSFNYFSTEAAADNVGIGGRRTSADAKRMTLGAWAVEQPGGNLKAGKHYESSEALTDAAKGLLDERLGESDGGKATYTGQAVGITVTDGMDDSDNEKFKASYAAWADGAVSLTADFEKMELSGNVQGVITGSINSGVDLESTDRVTVNLKKASIANYAVTGTIEKGLTNPTKTGDWKAEFTNDGTWIIGEFEDTPKSKQDNDYMQHYGTFGATCSGATCNQ